MRDERTGRLLGQAVNRHDRWLGRVDTNLRQDGHENLPECLELLRRFPNVIHHQVAVVAKTRVKDPARWVPGASADHVIVSLRPTHPTSADHTVLPVAICGNLSDTDMAGTTATAPASCPKLPASLPRSSVMAGSRPACRGSHRVLVKDDRQRIWAYHDGVDLGGPVMARIAKDYGYTLAEMRKL